MGKRPCEALSFGIGAAPAMGDGRDCARGARREGSMEAWMPYLLEWGSMLLRWLHVTTAIAWIGSSFMFMHLDASLRKEKDMPPGVYGVSWQVHGGGFYEMSKYTLAPPVHARSSRLAQMAIVLDLDLRLQPALLGLLRPIDLLPDRSRRDAARALAGRASPASPRSRSAGSSTIFSASRRSPRSDALLALVGFGYVVATSYVFTLIFSGRGALIHTGALMATMMTANVFFIIMPNQRKSIAKLIAGQTPDPKWGKEAKQRSTHNNYITLPVLFMMLSNHYPVTYANRRVIPAMVTLVIIAGALVRYFYNMWHADHDKAPWWAWFVAAVADLGGALGLHGGLARHARGSRPRARGRRLARPRSPCPRRRPTSSRSSRRAARCAMRPSRCSRGSAKRPRACCSTRPNTSPPSRRRSACRP